MPKNYWDQPFDDIEDTRFLEIEDQMVLTYNELSLQKKNTHCSSEWKSQCLSHLLTGGSTARHGAPREAAIAESHVHLRTAQTPDLNTNRKLLSASKSRTG